LEISNVNNFLKNDERNSGSLFLKYKNARPNVMKLDRITPTDQTPVSKGSGVTGSIPGIFSVSETRIMAGKITEVKLIKTMLIEKRKTIHGMICLFFGFSEFISVFSILSEILIFSFIFFFNGISKVQKYLLFYVNSKIDFFRDGSQEVTVILESN